MSLWRTKSLQFIELEANSGQQKLERTLGPFSLILLGIGAIVGAGLFSVTGIAAANNAGPAITLAFILAAIGCAFTGLCLSELAAMMPVAGGAYSYTYATLGELIAWVVGWLLILQYGTGAITVAISWSGYVISFLQGINIHLPIVLTASPWQPTELLDGSIVYGWINLPALVIVLLLSSLLICGVEKSSKVNNALVVVKMSVVFIFIAVGVFYITPSNYTPFVPQNQGSFGEFGWSGVMRASGIVFLAYIGFDAVATTAQEVKNPQKSLPIGIIGSLIVCTVISIFSSTSWPSPLLATQCIRSCSNRCKSNAFFLVKWTDQTSHYCRVNFRSFSHDASAV